MKTWEVLDGRGKLILGESLEVMRSMPKKSVDMVFGSPPYCDARTYDDGTLPEEYKVSLSATDWVEWMFDMSKAALRVSRGPVFWVVAGVTRSREYQPAVEGLIWEWYKRGKSQYRPVYWYRSGIPGSGGDQWFRSDIEHIVCFRRPGPLPYANPTACGHTPRYGEGGAMSNRTKGGRRTEGRPVPGAAFKASGIWNSTTGRKRNGERMKAKYFNGARSTAMNGEVLANPGNLLRTNNGGSALGCKMAHDNEAPFPEKLPDFFIRSFTKEDDLVLDPFGGSGTTAAVCVKTKRRFITIDIRSSQIKLMKKRLHQANITKGFTL